MFVFVLLPFCQARFKLDLCIDQDALIHPADQTKRGAEASFLSVVGHFEINANISSISQR
jgi:hypothetical protein